MGIFRAIAASILLSTLLAPATVSAQEAPQDWENWLAKYASSSAIVALNKNSLWKYDENQFEQIRNYKDFIQLPNGAKIQKNDAPKMDIRAMNYSKGLSPRSGKMVERMENMIAEPADGELLIFFVGALHGTDLFLKRFVDEKPHGDVVYASYTKNEETKIESLEKAQLLFMLKKRDTVEEAFFRDNSGTELVMLSARLYFILNVRNKVLRYQDLVREADIKKPRAIVLLESHGIRERAVTDDLPDAASLKKMGISKVRVGFEFLPAQKEVTFEELKELYDVGVALSKSSPQAVETMKTTNPEAHALLTSGKVLVHPHLKALSEKLESYAKGEIQLKMEGIDYLKDIRE